MGWSISKILPGAVWLVFLVSCREIKPPEPPAANVLPAPTPTAAASVKKEDFEREPKLQAAADALLPLFDKMPPVPVYLKDEVVNRAGSNTERGVAYTTCENQKQPVIYLKRVFYQKANQKQLVNILKHELTHAWQCRQGFLWGHDARFRKKFKEAGGFGN